MNLNREILRLSVPSILANITVPLVGMVDIAVVGHLGGEAAVLIGGISIGSMLFDLLYWSFAFLRTGTGGLTAQAYGRGDNAAVAATLRRALRIALLSGVALLALQWPVAWAAFQLIPCSPAVQEMARRYFFLRIWAAPATLSLFALKGWFIGMQDSLRPMTADLLVNGVNILLSVVLSYGLPGLWNGLGFSGVALGTVIAQWSGFLYCLLALRRRYRPVLEAKKTADTTWNAGAFFALNRDLVLRSFGMIAVYIGFTFLSARYGDLMLAVSSILMKFLLKLLHRWLRLCGRGPHRPFHRGALGPGHPLRRAGHLRLERRGSPGFHRPLRAGRHAPPAPDEFRYQRCGSRTRLPSLAAADAPDRLPGLCVGRHFHRRHRRAGAAEFHAPLRPRLLRCLVGAVAPAPSGHRP